MHLMIRKLALLTTSLMLAACGPDGAPSQKNSAGGAVGGCHSRAFADIGGPISLIDTTGAAVTEADFKGRPSLIYFGFTYCPDICPATLVTIERALQRLPEDVQPPRTILISIDPERDTPEAMTSYISTKVFPDDIVGLTGSSEQIKAAADAFKIGYQRIELGDDPSDYTVDHSSILYLMDENWSLKTFFTHEATPQNIGDCLAVQLENSQ